MGTPGTRWEQARAFAAWWILLAALWLALVDRIELAELLVGAVVALLGAAGALLVRRERTVIPRLGLRRMARGWRPLLGLVTDLPVLVRALPRRGGGSFVRVPFRAGRREDPDDAGRRVLTMAFGSLAPATYVVDVSLDDDELLVHRLRTGGDPERDADPLGLG
jgi:multisubunit Na+/H+ antiporter MnhE subunit